MHAHLSRRNFVIGSAAAILSTARLSAQTDWPSTLPLLDGLVKVRNRAGGGRVFWHYEGDFYGKLHDESAVPLMRIEGASISYFRRKVDGTYEWSLAEAGYFVDLETREVLDDWENPLNGAVVEPEHYRSGQKAAMNFVGKGGFEPLEVTLPPEVSFRGDLSGPTIHGDDVWFGEELFFGSPSAQEQKDQPSVPSVRVATSLATWRAKLSEVLDDSIDFVSSTLHYTTINSWRPWMKMGETPGVISWRLLGSKHQEPNEIPEHLVNRIENDHPGFFESNT